MIRDKGINLSKTNTCKAMSSLAPCYQEISGVRSSRLLWMPIPCMICESLYPLSNFRRVVEFLPLKSTRITLADKMMASPAVIMKERRIYASWSIGRPTMAEPWCSRPFAVSAGQHTPCPATPESLGVDSGADVQFSVPMIEDCEIMLRRAVGS